MKARVWVPTMGPWEGIAREVLTLLKVEGEIRALAMGGVDLNEKSPWAPLAPLFQTVLDNPQINLAVCLMDFDKIWTKGMVNIALVGLRDPNAREIAQLKNWHILTVRPEDAYPWGGRFVPNEDLVSVIKELVDENNL